MNTAVITSIYKPFWGTQEFYKSCERVRLPVYNAFTGDRYTGNGDVIRMIYEQLLKLKDKYTYAIYADGADSLFIKSFTPPDYILYSTEKAVWPPLDSLKEKWNEYYYSNPDFVTSSWLHLNGGGYCGPIKLLIDFFETYGLNQLKGDLNGQLEQSEAFLKAKKEAYPIFLDTECKYFQTLAHAAYTDFYADQFVFRNMVTGSEPCVLHGNGRTEMTSLYKMFNK